jgi:hypothetical protein
LIYRFSGTTAINLNNIADQLLYRYFDQQIGSKVSISYHAKHNSNGVIFSLARLNDLKTYFYPSVGPYYYQEGQTSATFPGNLLSPNTWSHLTFTFDYTNKIMQYYREGTLQGTFYPGTMTPLDQTFIFSIVRFF